MVSTRANAERKQFVDLQYEVDPSLAGCPDALGFRNLVARKLGYDPHRTGEALGLEVRLAQSEAGLLGTIEWRTQGGAPVGQRRFSSRVGDCLAISSTMGFVVAVQLQMMMTESQPRPTVAAEDSPSPSPAESSPSGALASGSAIRRPTAKPRPRRLRASRHGGGPPTRTTLAVGAGPSIGFGLGPEPMVLGRVFSSLSHGAEGFELGALASLPTTTRRGSAGFRYQTVLGTVAACGELSPVVGCGLAYLGVLRVRGTGVDRPAVQNGFAALAGLRFGYPLALSDSLAVLAHLDGLYLLTPWAVELNHEEVWSMPRLSAVAGIELVFRFR